MRDVNRIKPFCNTLATEWSKVPDWRLGQLIENLKRAYNINDLFYMEDDEFIEKLKDMFKEG
jgi:hypothetical protein